MERKKIVFGALIFLFIVALVLGLTNTICIIFEKNRYIESVKEQIENSVSISELEDKLQESEKAKAEIQSQLDAANGEKARLEEENRQLKTEIEKLKAAAKPPAASSAAGQQTLPKNKVCYLTFDDGPSENTLKILDILAMYGAKATFFVTNQSVASQRTHYIKNIHEAGHTVGLHTASHVYANIYSSEAAYFADLQMISDIVKSYTGVESRVIRFPGGSSNGVSRKYCPGIMTRLTAAVTERGYAYFDWNVTSNDASGAVVSQSRIVNSVLQGAANKNSICVLMHDNAAKVTTVQALPAIIEGLSAQGFRFEALTPESYGYHHPTLNN